MADYATNATVQAVSDGLHDRMDDMQRELDAVRQLYDRLLGALRRHEPGPMYDFLPVRQPPPNGGSLKTAPMYGPWEGDEIG